MRLVQRRRMKHGRHARHAVLDERPVHDRAGMRRVWTFGNIEPDNFLSPLLQDANQRLAQMTRTARDQYRHACLRKWNRRDASTHWGKG